MNLDEITYNEVLTIYENHQFHSTAQKKIINLLKSKGFKRIEALEISQKIFSHHFKERYSGFHLVLFVISFLLITFVLLEILPDNLQDICKIIALITGVTIYSLMIRLKR